MGERLGSVHAPLGLPPNRSAHSPLTIHHSRPKQPRDFLCRRIPPRDLLGEDHLSVLLDIEDTLTGGGEDERLNRVLLTDRHTKGNKQSLRQTGGTRSIVSLHAKNDFEVHTPLSLSS